MTSTVAPITHESLRALAALMFRLAVLGAVVVIGGKLAAIVLGKNPLAGA